MTNEKATLVDVVIERIDEHEYNSLHDVVLEVCYISAPNWALDALIRKLPEDILCEAKEWGFNDTVVRDSVYVFLQSKVSPL